MKKQLNAMYEFLMMFTYLTELLFLHMGMLLVFTIWVGKHGHIEQSLTTYHMNVMMTNLRLHNHSNIVFLNIIKVKLL